MPILRPYTQQTPAPQGQIDVQSSSQDFGQQVGAGIQQAGQGVESLNDSERAVVEQKGQIWAIKAASDMRLNQMKAMEDMQQDPAFAKKYGEDGGGFVAAYRQQFEDSANAALDSAPTGQARRFLNSQLTELGGSMSDQAMKFQSVTGAQWATNSLTQTMNQNQSATYMNPSQRQTILDSTNASIDAMPHLDQTQRDKLKLDAKKMSAFAAGRKDAVDANKDLLGLLDPTLAAKLSPTAAAKQVVGSNIAVQLPNDAGADLVKPYKADRIAQITQMTKAPSQYDDLFQKAAQAFGVNPQELKMRSVAESGLDPKAVGPATKYGQSVGLAQMTEETAAKYGVTDRTDPQQSIFGMAHMLADLQSKAGGDESKVDKMYYGGESGANWGANTNQYAENLNAVRATLSGGDNVHTSFDQVLASVTQDKAPLKFDNAGSRYSYLNDLTFEEQYSIMREAKQNQLADATRQNQMLEIQAKATKLASKQGMSEFVDKYMAGKGSISDVQNDPRLDAEDKLAAIKLIGSGDLQKANANPQNFLDAFNNIHSDPSTPGHISDERQLVQLAADGKIEPTAAGLGRLRDELQGRGTTNGELYGDLKKSVVNEIHQRLNKSNFMGGPGDPAGPKNEADATRAFLIKWDELIKAGKNPLDFTTAGNKDDIVDPIVKRYTRTLEQQVQDSMAKFDPPPPDKNSGMVKVVSPDGKTTGTIPAGQLQDALKQGYKAAQ